jgi:hypothetical protein
MGEQIFDWRECANPRRCRSTAAKAWSAHAERDMELAWGHQPTHKFLDLRWPSFFAVNFFHGQISRAETIAFRRL